MANFSPGRSSWPGLKFQLALRGEILLRLHGEFQTGFKHNFSIVTILFRWIFRQCACSNSRFCCDCMRFFSLPARDEHFQPGPKPSPCNRHFHFKKDFFQNPGWNSPYNHPLKIEIPDSPSKNFRNVWSNGTLFGPSTHFWYSGNFSREISVPFALPRVPKFLEYLVEWKAPNFSPVNFVNLPLSSLLLYVTNFDVEAT